MKNKGNWYDLKGAINISSFTRVYNIQYICTFDFFRKIQWNKKQEPTCLPVGVWIQDLSALK